MTLTLSLVPGILSICRLDPSTMIPDWVTGGTFFSISRTPDELSIVCLQDQVPDGIHADQGWRGLRVQGPLDFALTGILASLATPLAQAGISIFALSTFDTDYVLVKAVDLDHAVQVLRRQGHIVHDDRV